MNSAAGRKPLPLRPGQERTQYSSNTGGGSQFGGPLNGSGPSSAYASGGGQNYARMGPASPTARTVLEGYRNEIMTGFEKEKPRYNPANTSRPQSSTLVNFNDPIQVHLLVETALGDSSEFEILSQEEVDDLKKQSQSLTQRIETTRQNLAIQSKYRDAAISMAKLYAPSDKKRSMDSQDGKKRRSLLGNRNASSDQVLEADRERLASERRCEELALELWNLERRLMEPQQRLLKHTAGILQMTHKAPKRMPKSQGITQQPGIPGSPESMYTYSNGRASMDRVPEDDFFDERSLYQTADRLDMFGGDFDVGRSMDPVPPPLDTASKDQVDKQMRTIAMTEARLEDLNNRLREVIIKANPQSDTSQSRPPRGNSGNNGEMLLNHLDYLEQSIAAIDINQNTSPRSQEESEATMERTVEKLNQDMREVLLPFNAAQPLPPQLTGRGLEDQLLFFQDIISSVETELTRASSTPSKNFQNQGSAEQMETVLIGLWDIIQSGEADIRKRKTERRQMRSAQGYPPDEDDMSDDDMDDSNEAFSLPAFSSKVQWLYTQATSLKDQKKVLQRQIKQQRELNNKSDATKDAELAQKSEEVERIQALLVRTEKDADSVRQQLSEMMEKLDDAQQAENLRQQSQDQEDSLAVRAVQEELTKRNRDFSAAQEELAARARDINTAQGQLAERDREFVALQDQLSAKSQQIIALEAQLQNLKDEQKNVGGEIQGRLASSESKIVDLTAQVATAVAAKSKAEELVATKDKELSDKESELDGLFEKVAQLQTEVTIARAELDGAYGSRSQRAADVSANPAVQREMDNLNKRNTELNQKNASLTDELASLTTEIASLKASQSNAGASSKEATERENMLKRELSETIEEYEQMTKASIEWEKERETLESTIDKLRDEREKMEAELSDEKVRWLGMKSPGLDGAGLVPGATSTTVLKNEFKKMMRDTRAENAKALRAEQEARRRVEEELRALKKVQGPGKSGLSQSVAS